MACLMTWTLHYFELLIGVCSCYDWCDDYFVLNYDCSMLMGVIFVCFVVDKIGAGFEVYQLDGCYRGGYCRVVDDCMENIVDHS